MEVVPGFPRIFERKTMFFHVFWVLLLVNVTNSFSTLDKRVSYQECNIDAAERLDCGYPGITEFQCNIRECCYTSETGSPACYHSEPTLSRTCALESHQKVQCGPQRIRKEQCLALECCWQPSNDGPWCYEEVLPPIYTGECGKTAVSPQTRNWRVIGGEEAVPNSWPWMVSLQYDGGHVCGGSILNERWILSAAHCAFAFSYESPISLVVSGAHNLAEEESTTVEVMMEEIIPNQDYLNGERAKDLLLIRLTEPLEFNDFIRPVCVAEERPAPGTNCYSTGWGLDELYISEDDVEWSIPDELQQFMSPIIDVEVCNSTGWYDGMIPPTSICAGWEEGGRGNCFGDSGGPLVCFDGESWQQVGIVSWGMPCALARYPTVYASVADNLLWVKKELSKFD